MVVVVSEKLTSERAHELKSERAAGDGASHSSTRLYNVQYGWDLLWNIHCTRLCKEKERRRLPSQPAIISAFLSLRQGTSPQFQNRKDLVVWLKSKLSLSYDSRLDLTGASLTITIRKSRLYIRFKSSHM